MDSGDFDDTIGDDEAFVAPAPPEVQRSVDDKIDEIVHRTLNDEMKQYEVHFGQIKLEPNKPWIARLDGRGFSKYTKNMEKPFDASFSTAMVAAATSLLDEFDAALVYTQSDEISLAFYPREEQIFDGKIQKLCSVMASLAASEFNLALHTLGTARVKPATFDCRIIPLEDMGQVARNLMWRQHDARRNSISMAAHYAFGHKKMLNVGTATKLQMLEDAGTPWTQYNSHYRMGTFMRKMVVDVQLTEDELSRIPEKYRPTGPVPRSKVFAFDPGVLRGVDCLQKLFNKE